MVTEGILPADESANIHYMDYKRKRMIRYTKEWGMFVWLTETNSNEFVGSRYWIVDESACKYKTGARIR